MRDRNKIIKKLKEALAPDRFKHSLRVEKIALALAKQHGISPQKTSLAALLHDYARQYSRPELLKQAKRFKLKIDKISRFEPKLLHAELSAILARRDFGVNSKQVLGAIRKHTVGAPKMNKLEKIIYLADHLEEGRNYAGVKRIRSSANRNLDKAIAESSTSMLKHLLEAGLPIHPATIETRNYYLI